MGRAALMTWVFLVWVGPAPAQEVPEARRGEVEDTVGALVVSDPYRWMEEMRAPEVMSWVRRQDEQARAFAHAWNGHAAMVERIGRTADHFRYLPPVRRGDRYFFLRTNSSFTRVDLLASDESGEDPRVLLAGEDLAGEGMVLDRLVRPDPSGRYVAVGVGAAGSRWMEVRVLDVDRGAFLPDRVPGLVGRRVSNLSWAPDGSGFFYDAFTLPQEDARRAPLRGSRVAFHALGTAHEEDRTVFAPEAPDRMVTHDVTDDGAWLVLRVRDGRSPGNSVHVLPVGDGARTPTPLVPGFDQPYDFVGNDGEEIWLRTTRDAPNGRIVGLTPGPDALREIVPEQEGAIDDWTGARAVGDRIVAGYRIGGRLELRAFRPGGPGEVLPMPELGSVWTGFVGAQGDPEFYFVVSGFADPGTVYRHDLRRGESEVFRKPDIPYDPAEIVTRLVHYRGAAGEGVPMYIAHRRGLALDRPRPTMVYGYGFGRWSASPWFRPHMASWFRMGGVFALPALRGGGELGEEWHVEGTRRNRQNAIDDYLDASRWLVEEGITSPDLLVAETNSAGGSLVPAAVQQRPDLFGAAVYGFPVLDMVRFDAFTGGHRWRSELGDPSDPGDLAAILAYSPVHNTAVGGCHPPTMVTPGELDETTPPAHAYKFVAVTREAQRCEEPILLRVSWGAEHAYGRDQTSTVANFADQLSFLGRVLGLEAPSAPESPDRGGGG